MIKKINKYKSSQSVGVFLGLIAVLFGFAFKTVKQHDQDIVLQDEPLHTKGGEYFITEIKDGRTDRGSIAALINAVVSANKITATKEQADLQGGTAPAIKQFISRNLPQYQKGHAIIAEIKELHVTETALPNNRVQGKVNIGLSFSLKYNEDIITHLVDYHSTTTYNRPLNVVAVSTAEPVLRHVIENAFVYFDNWINIQANDNPKLAKGVQVTFSDFTEKDKPQDDTVYYLPSRPITWNDFRDHPRSARYTAEVLPGFGYTESAEVENGMIKVHVVMKVYLPKSSCWVRDDGMNDYSLNHEQRHFDIVKLVSEHFKEKIAALKLPVYNYEGPVHVQYFESYREMDQLQKQYDDETGHGLNEGAQQRWNERIDKELKKYKLIPGRQI